MGKKKNRQPAKIVQGIPRQSIGKPNPQEILQKAGQLKNKFAQVKGQTDQMTSDAVSDMTNGFLQLIGDTIQYAQQLEQQLAVKNKPKAETPAKQ
jgi:hypothetical protein